MCGMYSACILLRAEETSKKTVVMFCYKLHLHRLSVERAKKSAVKRGGSHKASSRQAMKSSRGSEMEINFTKIW